eukprot:CAMPEP_0184714848 /NCGR_PEP_ID=MMETSP0314-20130426/4886_1 /TAXON_ID=38298 /ORGANISM="Rhodella maculata, Strain CCMP 736" /LENGTH=132 /DNA_ID=CAMNT_0027177847 /DNA_START=217 /DNA_END=615 /DNA_ORIENTATION=+
MSSNEKGDTTASNPVADAYEMAKETAASTGETIKNTLGLEKKDERTAAEKLADGAAEAKDAAVGGFGEAGSALSEGFKGARETASKDAAGKAENAGQAVKGGAEGAAENVGNVAEGAAENVKSALGQTEEAK